MITGYGTVKDAVDAIKQGAADFITKPFQFDALLHVLTSAMEQRRLKSENDYLRSQLQERYRIDGLVGRSRVMRDLFQLLEIVAGTSSTVLITGETGTGKELAAKAIHHNSARRTQRFLAKQPPKKRHRRTADTSPGQELGLGDDGHQRYLTLGSRRP